MKEIVSQIEDLLVRGCTILDLINLHGEDGIDAKIYWQIVKLTLDFRLWTAEISHKAGHNIEKEVLVYLIDLHNKVKTQLILLTNAAKS
jgi:hypothetical protein